MPLYNEFASWIVPSVIMATIGLLFTKKAEEIKEFELVNE